MFIYNDKAVRYFGDNLESQKKQSITNNFKMNPNLNSTEKNNQQTNMINPRHKSA